MNPVDKHEVASELLESALYHYYQSNSYFSALHCAGAAETILGTYVTELGGKSSYEQDSAALRKIGKGLFGEDCSDKELNLNSILNGPRNLVKHGIEDLTGSVQTSAKQMLERAIRNYNWLEARLDLCEIKNINLYEADQ